MLISKGQKVSGEVIQKIRRFTGVFKISPDSFEIWNGANSKREMFCHNESGNGISNEVKLNNICNSPEESCKCDEVIQSFGQRKGIRNERILEKPNKLLSSIIFESKNEPWWIYINALANRLSWLYTHSIDVAMMSLIIAVELGYGEKQLYNLGLGALMHDVGKLLLPKEIIEKQEPLSITEEILIQQHCELGVSSLVSFNLPHECTNIVMQHHERLDGSGYPKGLKDNEISLDSRIVMIADAIDTISAGRPSRPDVYGLDEAIRIIKSEEGFSIVLLAMLEKILH